MLEVKYKKQYFLPIIRYCRKYGDISADVKALPCRSPVCRLLHMDNGGIYVIVIINDVTLTFAAKSVMIIIRKLYFL